MKIMVTGASGFIGRNAVAQLSEAGHGEIVAVSRRPLPPLGGVRAVAADLLEPGVARGLIKSERPTHLLHLAWNATPGKFWTSPDNLDWMAASLQMQRAFQDEGGVRLVSAGTCAEYDWEVNAVLSEDATPLKPRTLYGISKHALASVSLAAARENGLSAAWGRVFWLYGPHEASSRLVADVASALIHGRVVETSEGLQRRDFFHVADVAGAFVAALFSSWHGAFNIGSGIATPVCDIVLELGRLAGRPDLLRLGARPSPLNDPPCLVADTKILSNEIGFAPKWPLSEGLSDVIAWWAASKSS